MTTATKSQGFGANYYARSSEQMRDEYEALEAANTTVAACPRQQREPCYFEVGGEYVYGGDDPAFHARRYRCDSISITHAELVGVDAADNVGVPLGSDVARSFRCVKRPDDDEALGRIAALEATVADLAESLSVAESRIRALESERGRRQ